MSFLSDQLGDPLADPSNPLNPTNKAYEKEKQKQQQQQQILDSTPNYLKNELSESNPLPWQSYLPKEITDLGSDIQSRANPQSQYQQAMSGVNINPSMGATNVAPSPMSAAISRKYQRGLGNSLQSLMTNQQIQSQTNASNELNRAGNVFAKQYQLQVQNFKEQYAFQQQRMQMYQQWMAAQNAAKSNFFSSVLGGMLGIGGMLLGGPAGAAAGAAAGSSAGTAIA